jgi:hypothetical protein
MITMIPLDRFIVRGVIVTIVLTGVRWRQHK